ncbi:hypothetical protein HDU98_009883 [Podochytrium sp. JEL0797]|nr:hypothetical protein HDU98_009883 [Podochytrium sp. JEL0797]
MKKVKSVTVTGETSDTSVPCFVPAKSWEKVPGYKVSSSTITGSNSAEKLNFAAVATMSGFSRDHVEPGLRDIVHALVLVLKRGSHVSLLFADMGRLIFHQREVRFCFQADFLDMIATGVYRAPEIKMKPDLKKPAAEISSCSTPDPESNHEIPEEIKESHPQSNHHHHHHHNHAESSSNPHENPKNESTPPALAPEKPKDPKQEEQEEIERLAILLMTRGDTHTHPHAGNRLWSDAKCPICRQKNQVVVEVKDQIVEREKTQDKMLLMLSLEVDREFLKKTREVEEKKVKAAMGTAMYNYKESAEKEFKRRVEKRNLPLGNMFENRDPGPDRVLQAKELRAGLHDQMTIKRTRKTREKVAKDVEDRELNDRLLKEFKTAEVQNHFDKMRRRQQQQTALTEQMATQELARQRELILEPMTENSYARSETLMFLYQKEKAKQLYQEQLAILKQRRDYEVQVADMEKNHSLERLSLSRKELSASF